MHSSQYLIFLCIFIILYIAFRTRKLAVARRMIKKRKTEVRTDMISLAKQFIGKECLLYSFDGNHQYQGVIQEVSDSAVLVEKDGKLEAINLEYVIRIREYPKNKKGKKKSIVVD